MNLQEHLERSGAWLFRWHSYVLLVLLAMVMAALAQAGDLDAWSGDHLSEILCVGISLLGLVLRAMVVGFTPKGTSGRNTTEQVAETLNTTGIYSVVRHPLYLGNFLTWLGVALYPRLWWLAVIVVLSFWLYYERIMLAEEAFLHGKFGNDFRRWAGRTPAFVPAPSRWRAPGRRFSPRKVLRKELSGMLGGRGHLQRAGGAQRRHGGSSLRAGSGLGRVSARGPARLRSAEISEAENARSPRP